MVLWQGIIRSKGRTKRIPPSEALPSADQERVIKNKCSQLSQDMMIVFAYACLLIVFADCIGLLYLIMLLLRFEFKV